MGELQKPRGRGPIFSAGGPDFSKQGGGSLQKFSLDFSEDLVSKKIFDSERRKIKCGQLNKSIEK